VADRRQVLVDLPGRGHGASAEGPAAALRTGKRLPTLTLESDVRFRSPGEQKAFAEELAQAFAALVASTTRLRGRAAPSGSSSPVIRPFRIARPTTQRRRNDEREA
jgi:hypothetical protein